MTIADLRKRIDEIDREVVGLLNERASSAVEISLEKRKEGAPVHDPEREEAVLSRVRALNKGPISDAAVVGIYRQIIVACRDVQK